jgi:hypothetical protein
MSLVSGCQVKHDLDEFILCRKILTVQRLNPSSQRACDWVKCYTELFTRADPNMSIISPDISVLVSESLGVLVKRTLTSVMSYNSFS